MKAFQEIKAHAILILFITEAISNVRKSKKCIKSKWINFREERASLISTTNNINNAIECFKSCTKNPYCKKINYNELDKTCEIRGSSSAITSSLRKII